MLIIGVTGGSGAGKSTLLRVIEKKGGEIIDCDALYQELLRTDDDLRGALSDTFGDVFLPDGALNRTKLGNIVFGDEDKMTRLNEIVFRRVYLAVERKLDECRAKLAAVEAINLIQGNLAALCEVTVGVIAPKAVRLTRIMQRDGIEREYAEKRIDAQEPDSFYFEHCDYILKNDFAKERLYRGRCEELIDEIMGEYL